MSEFWLYLQLGITHVLDIKAYDHLLFLVVLSIPYSFANWKKVLILVSTFTLGHSLSLLLATYKLWAMNSDWIEFLIPLTILITALYNIYNASKVAKQSKKAMLYFGALFFGLIHGLGFSTYFDLIVGNASSKILPLAEFALGIELAQIIIMLGVLLVTFAVLGIGNFSKRKWVVLISAIVAVVAIPMIWSAAIW